MKFTIGKFDPNTATVTVTFRDGDMVHRRPVNACIDATGKYDKTATKTRVEEVAVGMAHKFALGLFGPEVGTTDQPGLQQPQ